jgi:NAD(P)-dependent dehydrogenase (short-subunit alcohol dehydrogenase family)
VDVNITANWRLIRSCDPLLRASDAGRAIFVTSGAATAPYPYWGIYGMTKTALEMLVKTYALEVEKLPLRVNLLDPGVVRTRMREQAFPGEEPMTLPPPETVTDRFVELAVVDCPFHGEVVGT